MDGLSAADELSTYWLGVARVWIAHQCCCRVKRRTVEDPASRLLTAWGLQSSLPSASCV